MGELSVPKLKMNALRSRVNDLRQLTFRDAVIFCYYAETGSYKKTAKKYKIKSGVCGVKQSIRRIQRICKTSLFVPGTWPRKLTEAGEILVRTLSVTSLKQARMFEAIGTIAETNKQALRTRIWSYRWIQQAFRDKAHEWAAREGYAVYLQAWFDSDDSTYKDNIRFYSGAHIGLIRPEHPELEVFEIHRETFYPYKLKTGGWYGPPRMIRYSQPELGGKMPAYPANLILTTTDDPETVQHFIRSGVGIGYLPERLATEDMEKLETFGDFEVSYYLIRKRDRKKWEEGE